MKILKRGVNMNNYSVYIHKNKLNGKVYILARNEEKTLKSIEEIKKETNNNNVHFIKSPNKDDAMFSRDKETRDYFKTFWHSSTHLLAYALEQYYGDKIKLIHGPPGDGIPYCFFYEVALSVMNCS